MTLSFLYASFYTFSENGATNDKTAVDDLPECHDFDEEQHRKNMAESGSRYPYTSTA